MRNVLRSFGFGVAEEIAAARGALEVMIELATAQNGGRS